MALPISLMNVVNNLRFLLDSTTSLSLHTSKETMQKFSKKQIRRYFCALVMVQGTTSLAVHSNIIIELQNI